MAAHVIAVLLGLFFFGVAGAIFREGWTRLMALSHDAHVVEFLILAVVVVAFAAILIGSGSALVPHVTALLP